ncbi:AAA family ATPase [Chryseobacterium sp. 8AT]|uniref:AAA family ATPase n=1 Tax=Chryseobacterium sp. 8AT TaxID=2653134 RepID=UPI0012F465DB|nr:AAA family ATPase [Chryseobacterium sp. 8AT]VXC33368.1 conserved hypothetical protein [Chryseobacterium sp. 8AT]
MLITKIYAKNYKTYKEVDLDLSVNPDQPIVLIGGQNGGGKTTLFQAIYSALYGLEVKDLSHFKRLLSADTPYSDDVKIELEIDFKGKVLTQDFLYKIKRVYAINTQNQPVESVSLNFNGDVFTYGSAMPFSQRNKMEAEVNKIIKANLPKELSKYFLFDAMESGELLKADYLSRVIKENIENVMGFNKYINLEEATHKLKEKYIADSIELESERLEYQKIIDQKSEIETKIKSLKEELKVKLGYSIDKKDLYKKAKEGKNLQQEFQDQIKHIESKIDDLKAKEAEYVHVVAKYADEIELQSFLPKLLDTIKEELSLIINSNDKSSQSNQFSVNQLDYIHKKISDYLNDNKWAANEVGSFSDGILSYIKEEQNKNQGGNDFSYFSDEELSVIRAMLNLTSINSFNFIHHSKDILQKELKQLPLLKADLAEAKSHLSNDDNSLIESYENNESILSDLKASIANLDLEIVRLNSELNKFDISEEEIPNPKLEVLKKLEPVFSKISNELLKAKKQRIENTMQEDLNSTLVAYADQIGKVELSENLSDLTFKIYHKHGNEIYLEELNAASKQIIVQVLLKALHQFGDYNPPVMIDTVMGYLDEESRASLLENYFPKLSHQTILLSTDSEIRTDKDLLKIEGFIAKKYTLDRDKVNQLTNVREGYFNA